MFYDQDPEREWLRLVRSPLEEIKLHIHSHYLRTYLAPGMRVLEIGAGPGRFTKVLHELGCSVVVGDISSRQLEANEAKAKELGFAASVERWLKLDICDMACLESGSFDAVVASASRNGMYWLEVAERYHRRRSGRSGGRGITAVCPRRWGLKCIGWKCWNSWATRPICRPRPWNPTSPSKSTSPKRMIPRPCAAALRKASTT
jgi:SAM-dependent methyltransferase